MRRTLGILWASGFAFFFSFYLLISSLPIYASAVGVSDRAIGLIIGCFAFASMVMKPWAGWASDRFGRRPLLLGGSVLFVAASSLYGLFGTALALVLVRLLHGSGMGLYPTAASALVADVAPPGRRGELLGFFGAAANVAMALGPIVGVEIARRLGFPALFAVCTGSALIALGLTAALPETLPHRKVIPFTMETTVSRPALFPSLIVLCTALTYGAQVSFLPIYADAQGVNPGLFFLVFALVVAAVRGRAGQLSDRVGRVPVTAAGLVIAAAALVLLAATRGALALAAAGALYGIGFGTAQPALLAWVADAVPPADRGRAMGTYFAAFELGIATGSVATGVAVSLIGFAPTFVAAAAAALAGAGLALTHRAPAPA